MTPNEIGRLAAAINLLRPDWPTDSLQTFIRNALANRTYRDAAVALTYVATDQRADGTNISGTPKRALTNGPWWRVGEDALDSGVRFCESCSRSHVPGPCVPRDERPLAVRDPDTHASLAAAAKAQIRPVRRFDALSRPLEEGMTP